MSVKLKIGLAHFMSAICFLSTVAIPLSPEPESMSYYWKYEGALDLGASVKKFNSLNSRKAKNVILFIGDGMGLTSITAGRIFKGQKENANATGEEYRTSIDKLPHTGLLKTYSVDRQTPDSAAASTAMLCGFKTKSGMIGVPAGDVGNCTSLPGFEEKCIMEHAKDFGKATGIVTTTRVQDATPAAAYAKTVNKTWYSDRQMSNASKQAGCKDISIQLLENAKNLNVVLGGGRAYMKPYGSIDREYPEHEFRGERMDGRDLIEEWHKKMEKKNAEYVWTKGQFDEVDPEETDYLLGLFEPFDMQYSVNRESDRAGEPSLSEMTAKAIKILKKDDDGFFLVVDAGRLDHAHHAGLAHVAMEEFLELERAVEVARNMTSKRNTLILVTADHGNVFTIGAGDVIRGNPILGLSPNNEMPKMGQDGQYFSTAGYANGPGGFSPLPRPSPPLNLAADAKYRFQATVPLPSVTHSSEDVVVFANGPMSHLVTGVHEHSYIGELIFYATCVGYHSFHPHCYESYSTENEKPYKVESDREESFMDQYIT